MTPQERANHLITIFNGNTGAAHTHAVLVQREFEKNTLNKARVKYYEEVITELASRLKY